MAARGDALETLATRLLSSTEALHAAVLEDASAEDVAAAWSDRVAAFETLREAIEAGERVGPAVRACVERVRELDALLLEQGTRLATRIQAERQALGRKRAVIQAHATRERPEPRAVAVKA